MSPHTLSPAKPRSATLNGWTRKLNETNALYFFALYRQFQGREKQEDFTIGENFTPSAMLSRGDRASLLNVTEYAELQDFSRDYEEAARGVALTLHPMNGGIGSSIRRSGYLEQIWRELKKPGEAVLGSKGADLYFDFERNGIRSKINISQAKVLHMLGEAGRYGRVTFQHFCSTDTAVSASAMLEETIPGEKQSYLQAVIQHPNAAWGPIQVQSSFPCVDEEGHLTDERTAPGGHGHWAVHLLLAALKMRFSQQDPVRISAVYNEDGINNGVDATLVGFMARRRIPVMMLFTTKTENDRKGGLLGTAPSDQGGVRKVLFEKSQVKGAEQNALFEEVGLTAGEPGGQSFNTNTALFNYSVLAPFLQDLAALIGVREFLKIISPDLIRNVKLQVSQGKPRQYVQLEGALGSSLLNLDNYLCGSRRADVRDLLAKHGFMDGAGQVRFLKIIAIGAGQRAKFFTPVKSAFDFWLQFHSDLYRFDAQTCSLEPAVSGGLPQVSLSENYDDVGVVLQKFRGVKVAGLRSLEVRGNVDFSDAILKGDIKITSDAEWSARETGAALLENIFIRIDPSGALEVKNYARK